MATDYEVGVLVGLLVGEGHFGGDGRQPQVTLRMHVRHEAIFLWLERVFPGGKLYGPYHHDGRHYYQWMARGPYLRDVLVPLLRPHLSPDLDAHAALRFGEMQTRYARNLGLGPANSEDDQGAPPDAPDEPPEPSSQAVPSAPESSPAEHGDRATDAFNRLRGGDGG